MNASLPPAALLQELDRWRQAGWLRRLDVAFARFIQELSASSQQEAPAHLLLAAALLAHVEGRGHSALPVHALAQDAAGLLEWPEVGTPALLRTVAACPMPEVDADWAALPVVSVVSGVPVPQRDGGSKTAGSTPLVLDRGLLALRRHWGQEHEVARALHERLASGLGSAAEASDAAPLAHQVRQALQGLFPPSLPALAGANSLATDWQQVACALVASGRFTLITGGPGTGKTHTAARALVLLHALHAAGGQVGTSSNSQSANLNEVMTPAPLRVALAAPTGKAAARLRQSIHQALQGDQVQGLVLAMQLELPMPEAGTLHKLLGPVPGSRRFRHDAQHPLPLDVLFVDEASMVHLELLAQVLQALPATARLILLGDQDQLASVEAGAVMADLAQGEQGYRAPTAAWVQDSTGQALPASSLGAGDDLAQHTVVLRHSHRFDGPIGLLAQAVHRADEPTIQQVLANGGEGPVTWWPAAEAPALLPLAVQGRAGARGGHAAYLALLRQRPSDAGDFAPWATQVLRAFEGFRVLTALREGPWGVAGLNPAIERALADAGHLPSRRGPWYEGRPVMVLRNDAELGVFNGDVGLVLRAPGGGLRCCFLDGDVVRSVSVQRLPEVETAYAMTVHKSQGSEFGHVVLVLPEAELALLTRELVYTGITRARQAFTLACPDARQLGRAAARRTRRISGLRRLLHGDSAHT